MRKQLFNIIIIILVISLYNILFAFSLPSSNVKQNQSQDANGPYFGQTPPGNIPQLFAQGILTLPGGLVAVTRIAFSPDGNECFFSGPIDWNFSSTRMYHTKCIDGVWTPHELVSFLPGYSCRQPYFSPGGDTLYFSSRKNGSSDIWMVQRSQEGWRDPQVLPYPVNTDSTYEGMYTLAPDGTAYIESNRSGGLGGSGTNNDVWKILPQQPGQPQQIQNLGIPVNSSRDDNDPFISPDGRYMITGDNYNDLWITFIRENGEWTNPINLNKFYPGISTQNQEYAPFISSDGKYLFFNRIADGGILWVSTEPINNITNINFPPYVKNVIPDQAAIQNSMFLYQIPDSTFFDDDGNHTLSFSATIKTTGRYPVASDWCSFDSLTQTFSGIPTDQASTYTATITATDTAGVYVATTFNITVYPQTKIKSESEPVPAEFKLNQNYPNPFNPSTTICYSIKEPSKVILTIYNLFGEKIRTLQNTFQITGEYSVTWDARNSNNTPVASGVYIYKLEAGQNIFQKKMIVLR